MLRELFLYILEPLRKGIRLALLWIAHGLEDFVCIVYAVLVERVI